MNTTKLSLSDLLTPAGEAKVRMKLLLYGDSGAGKTYSALQIAAGFGGKVAMLDPEAGSRLYASKFDFDVLSSDNLRQIQDVVRLLAHGNHDYRTLIIDPITLLWDGWMEQWTERFLAADSRASRGKQGEWYELQIKDWGPIKSSWKAFIRSIVHLDMNIIATAREKVMFDESGGKLRKVGETFDGEKGLPYWFDSRVRLSLTGAGKRLAYTEKDRTNLLPPPGPGWEWRTSAVIDAFASQNVAREVSATLADPAALAEIAELAGTVGVTLSNLNLKIRERFRCSIDELDPESAEKVAAGLRAAKQAKEDAEAARAAAGGTDDDDPNHINNEQEEDA